MTFDKRSFNLRDYKRFDAESREVFVFGNTLCDDLLEQFYARVIDAIDTNHHFPIIRIADGEYQFLLGKDEFNLRKPVLLLLRNLGGEIMRTLLRRKFEAKSRTYTSGVYSHLEKSEVREKYTECLKYISQNGILALYTIIKPNFYIEQYLPKLFRFFSRSDIHVDSLNYIPFYFVYIILTNERYSEIYHNKCVHLITSFDDARKRSIEQTLISLGVKSVTWTSISRDKSLFDVIDMESIDKNNDLIFIGAGVGKVNIFNQLKDFPAVVIDAGYIFETWQDSQLVYERDYCVSHV